MSGHKRLDIASLLSALKEAELDADSDNQSSARSYHSNGHDGLTDDEAPQALEAQAPQALEAPQAPQAPADNSTITKLSCSLSQRFVASPRNRIE